ncbi:bifunctional 3-dehydroquinate dehydratase/shikimate dehydrogenase [Cucumis melo var. makuwa]|uniref:Bifunctional 3-dehydroquinate dehydratase/shikimate dehydrogenase n=1 Tax=Cucumis melo var. makuwa TaxID=1194695 RepID=A0A5A7SIV9_CUCMM|nr:bifunctional 3-dehydroquinate dehydratase/shikimate dehydrogenase [Cucumis melo var. makuwa]
MPTGAVNFLFLIRRQSDEKLCGYNTDCYGAISAIEVGLPGLHNDSSTVGSCLAGKAQLVVVIGAGGVGKALACGAKHKGSARIVIANHPFGFDNFLHEDRARELADHVGGQSESPGDLENFHPENGMILTNATRIGMHPKVDELPFQRFEAQEPVMEASSRKHNSSISRRRQKF